MVRRAGLPVVFFPVELERDLVLLCFDMALPYWAMKALVIDPPDTEDISVSYTQ